MNKLHTKSCNKVKIEKDNNIKPVKYQSPKVKRTKINNNNSNSNSSIGNNIYIRPNYWSKKEESKLISLFNKFGNGNWDFISSKMVALGYKRTASQCFSKWYRLKQTFDETPLSKIQQLKNKNIKNNINNINNINNVHNINRIPTRLNNNNQRVLKYMQFTKNEIWSIQEDKKLRVLIELNGQDWGFIVSQMNSRTSQECISRWNQVLKEESSTVVETISLDGDEDVYYNSTHKHMDENKNQKVNYGRVKREIRKDQKNDNIINNNEDKDEDKELLNRVWTKAEVEKLKSLVNKFGKRWLIISSHMNINIPRSPVQCSSKYYKLVKSDIQINNNQPIHPRKSTISPIKSKNINQTKPLWSTMEDKKLIRLIELFGTDDFDYISSKFKNKDSIECSDRWNNHLKSNYLKQ